MYFFIVRESTGPRITLTSALSCFGLKFGNSSDCVLNNDAIFVKLSSLSFLGGLPSIRIEDDVVVSTKVVIGSGIMPKSFAFDIAFKISTMPSVVNKRFEICPCPLLMCHQSPGKFLKILQCLSDLVILTHSGQRSRIGLLFCVKYNQSLSILSS